MVNGEERPCQTPHRGDAGSEWAPAYSRLLRVAHRRLLVEPHAASFDTRELVQETFEKIIRQRTSWTGLDHVIGTARLLMERILIDRARRKGRAKRQAALTPIASTLPELETEPELASSHELAGLAAALERLRALDPRQARVVELRFLVGKSATEIAEMLGVTRRTVDRDWVHARCWLRRELSRNTIS